MGLSTGEASKLLQEFGIRNRDMVLLLMQGGDALRNARNDIQDYGLALSQVDAAAIEAANDQIGRLQLVGQFLQQEMARNLIPSFGMLAEAMTDSLREGGRLRAVLETIGSSTRTLVTIAATAVATFTAYRAILLATAGAKAVLTAASNGLRTALLRLGIPALVIAAGVLIDQFLRLVERTGGWADALSLLGDVASGVWEGISTSARAMVPALQAIFADIEVGFLSMIASMSSAFRNFMSTFTALSDLPALGITQPFRALGDAAVAATNMTDGFGEAAARAAGRADHFRGVASQMATEGFDKAREALSQLNATIQEF
jgi:phage-related protein